MSAPGKAGRWLAIAATLVVVAAVAAAIGVMGPPSAQREAKLDRKRTADLERIVRAVREHAQQHDTLPPDLATLARKPGRRLPLADPQDGTPYAYEATGPRSFRLCAVFATDTAKTIEGAESWNGEEWSHGARRQCFDRKLKDASDTR